MSYRQLISPVRKQLDIDEYEKEIKKRKSYRKLSEHIIMHHSITKDSDIQKLRDYHKRIAQVHFREDWKSVYNQADWYFLVYRFNIAGKKELYSIIQKYIRKADGTEYSDKELRLLSKEQLRAMFRQYKPSLFGTEPYNV